MMSKRNGVIVLAVVVASAAGGVLTAALQAGPPKPPGVGPNGVLNLSQLPEMVPVSDSEGNLAGYVDRDGLLGPGSLPPEAEVAAGPQKLPVFSAPTSDTIVGYWEDKEGFAGFVPLKK